MTNTEHSQHHIIPFRTYLIVFIALLFLTFVTVAVSLVDLGAANIVVALLVAGTKATLVALFFMHLLYDNKLYMLIFISAIAFLTIFITFTMFDTLQRDAIYDIRDTKVKEEAIIYDGDPDEGHQSDH